jgi:hypothetical protein
MSLHYSDESKRPRACDGGTAPRCDLCGSEMGLQTEDADGPCHQWACFCNGGHYAECGACEGTGRLGDPEARPDIEVGQGGPLGFSRVYADRWHWRGLGAVATHWSAMGYPTEADAVAAARKALRVTP